MGLDITAYEKVTLIAAKPVVEWADEDRDGITPLYVNDAFTAQADGLVDGFYRAEGAIIEFRAGSYGGYNEWRRLLAALIGTTPRDVWSGPDTDCPFRELIHFSDCEGIIGPKTSAKLARDFAELQPKVDEQHPNGGYFAGLYREWRQAFELAAKGGCVEFG